MRISLIGGGKVGITMLYYLKRRHRIIGVYDPDQKAQKRAARILGVKNPLPYPLFLSMSDAVFIATPDDEILKAYIKIKNLLKIPVYLVHFSGLLPADIFPKAKNRYRIACHPFATFPRLIIPPPRKKYPVFIQGDPQALRSFEKVFDDDHFTTCRINKKDKKILHLMGVMVSNLLVSLVDAANELASQTPLKKARARKVIGPLIEETLKNIMKYGIRDALSGPLKRGDIETIRGHLKILQKNKNRSAIYKSLSANLIRFAPADKKQRLRKLLK
jgi:predicted short-subunit dehydrogenase-like oxidoreductase (DUF2520 family)